jgi:hypothetical protein
VAGKFLDKIDFWIVFYELIFYVPHIRKDKMKGSIPGTSPSLILYFSLGSLAPPAITK